MRYRHVVEIGAGDSYSSEGLSWTTHADHVTLYEPHPALWADLSRAAAGMPNVSVVREAIANRFAPLYLFGYASFLHGAPSFLATSVEEGYERWWGPLALEVPLNKVDRIDGGEIDYLILTVNGGEVDILRALVSRPAVIRTKHYLHNARQWEDATTTFGWMHRERYVGRTLATNQHQTHLAIEWRREA